MVLDPQRFHMTAEEYLAFDRASHTKHEYLDGEVVAMAGGSTKHNRLALRMAFLLEEQLGATDPYRTYTSDMRVLVAKRQYVYPDVVVSCDISDHNEESDILYSPHLVVEVLSPSTELKDRGGKLTWYKGHPSIQEYVLLTEYSLRKSTGDSPAMSRGRTRPAQRMKI